MNLRTSILRGAFGTLALTLFASVQAQSITFTSDSWPGEVTEVVVTFNGDTILDVTGFDLWAGASNTAFTYSIGTFGAGDYTVYVNDTFGDGGTQVSVNSGSLNCTGNCGGTVSGSGTTYVFTLTSAVPGCTDAGALNYDPAATLDDGSCLFDICPDEGQIMAFVNMTDSWGDGWNGSTYSIFADGVLVATGSLDASVTGNGGPGGGPAAGQDTICLPNNACYEVISGGGAYLSEIGWTLVNVYTGAIISSDNGGGTNAFYLGDTPETCGCTDVEALNFDGNATVDDGSCVFPSCDNPDDVLVQFMMFDTFGDGWDGATYTLSNQAGEILNSGSLDDAIFVIDPGAQGYDFFCLSTTECYVLDISGGVYPGEKEWQIINYATGAILYDFTANNGFGTFGVAGPGVTCGCTDTNAFNYDASATQDDGSCFSPSCVDNPDSTSYILHLNHDIYLFWGNNGATIFDPVTGDTILAGGNSGFPDYLYTPDYEGSVVDGYWEFCIPNDACLNLAAGGGSPAGQPLWYILDFDGNIIHDGTLGVYDIGFGTEIDNCLSGCTLPAAINYNPDATISDGSCVVCDNGQLGLLITLQDDFATGWSAGNNYYVADVETGDTVLTGTMAAGLTTIESWNCLDIGCYTFSTGAIFTTEGWGLSDNIGNVYAPLTYGATDGWNIAMGGLDVTDCAFAGCTSTLANNYDMSASVDDGSCEFPPANDNPEDAQAIACEMILTGTLENSNGDQYSGTTVLGNSISNSGAIWYEFNADNDYQVTFNTCASADLEGGVTDTDVIVFRLNTDGSLTAIATNDDSGIAGCGSGTTGTFNSIVSINAFQGNNYLVRVGHFSSTSSQTGIVIEANCQVCPEGFPVNDDVCTLALPLVDGGNYTGSLCCSAADEDFGMPSLSIYATAYGVWYEVDVDSLHNLYNITVDATGTGAIGWATYNGDCTDLADMSSGVVMGSVQENMNQYFAAEQTGPVTVTINQPNVNNTYYLFLWTTQTADCGSYSISMSAEVSGCMDATASNYNPLATVNSGCLYVGVTQPNDSCSNAIAIACGETLSGNTGGATSVGGTNACGGSGSGVWYTLDNGGQEQLITVSTCGSTVNTVFEVFQEVDAPDAVLWVNSINVDNYSNISAVIVYNGDTIASIPAGELFPTVFNDYYQILGGGDYVVYFTNEGSEDDGITANVINSLGNPSNLCDGECSTDPTVCLNLQIVSDNYPGETTYGLVNSAGTTVFSGGISSGFNNFNVCVPPGSYTFTMYDSFGDGICCSFGSGSYTLTGPDGVLASGASYGDFESTSFSVDASPYNLPAGATISQTFSIFGGSGTCSSLICWNEGGNTATMSETCANGETFQFISDDNANTYAILVAAGSGSLGGPFDLSVTCEPVVYGCMNALACNYNADANVDDADNPCDFTSCLGCDTETWEYCYDNNETWSFTLVNPNGGTIVVDLDGTLIEQGWDLFTIDDAATGANLYDSDVDPDDMLVIGTDSLTVSFVSDGSVSCETSTTAAYYISMAITCAPAPSTGCADSTACNYSGPVDFADNSLCDYSCLGCTNPGAVNYSPFASVDDGSCCFGAFIEFNMFDSFGDGWNGATYTFYDMDGNAVATGGLLSTENGGDFDTDDVCVDTPGCYTLVVTNGSWPAEISWTISGAAFNNTSGGTGTYMVGLGTACTEGCTLPIAPNYVSPDSVDISNDALCDFDSVIMGCTYPDASNYNETATNDDGSCTFDIANPCPTDLNGDGQTTTSDLLIFLGAFGTQC